MPLWQNRLISWWGWRLTRGYLSVYVSNLTDWLHWGCLLGWTSKIEEKWMSKIDLVRQRRLAADRWWEVPSRRSHWLLTLVFNTDDVLSNHSSDISHQSGDLNAKLAESACRQSALLQSLIEIARNAQWFWGVLMSPWWRDWPPRWWAITSDCVDWLTVNTDRACMLGYCTIEKSNLQDATEPVARWIEGGKKERFNQDSITNPGTRVMLQSWRSKKTSGICKNNWSPNSKKQAETFGKTQQVDWHHIGSVLSTHRICKKRSILQDACKWKLNIDSSPCDILAAVAVSCCGEFVKLCGRGSSIGFRKESPCCWVG